MIESLQEIDDIIGDAPSTRHGNAQSLRIQDILRPIHGKVNELADAVNDLEATVYRCDDDICPDCWADTEPFIANLPDLSDEQLEALHDRVCSLLAEREEDDADCDCCDDGMCPDCYSQEFGDTDETVTDEVQKVVDDVRGKNEPHGIDTTDGLFSDFAGYVVKHPELRFYQALTNWSGYQKILGEDAGEDRYDLFHETTKGPKKGGA